MNRDDFQELMKAQFDDLLQINSKKGHDYAGDEDALANFKSAAARLHLTPEQVWATYADKHWSAIMTYCGEGQVESEPIEGRIDDALLYLFLLRGLIEERRLSKFAEDIESDVRNETMTKVIDELGSGPGVSE